VKYCDIMASLPRLLRAEDAEDYVAGPTVLADLRERYGLKPTIQQKKLTVYDRHDIDLAIENLKQTRA
jgi:hypothetical protein